MKDLRELDNWVGNTLTYSYKSLNKKELLDKEYRINNMIEFLNKNSKNKYNIKTSLVKEKTYKDLDPKYQNDYRLDIFITKK